MSPTRRATRAGALLGSLLLFGCAPRGSLDSPFTSEFAELAVAGHNAAIVSLPRGATSPRPLIVAAHGAGDRAEWHCELWRRIVGDRAFVLCPQGRRTDERVPHADASYYYPDHLALDKEVQAAVQALGERYRELVDAKQAVYTGFSQGAIHGSQVIVLHPDLFPRAALVEGGNGFFNEWSPYAARRFAKGGGQRVLFGCGSPACVRSAEKCAGYLRKTGVEARVVHAEGAGHSYGPAMEDELRENFEWLVTGDPRWAVD